MDKIKIALIGGGWSSEREISLKSTEAVYKALDRRKYEIRILDPRDDLKELIEAKKDIDLAFILLHGKYGEDGRMQGLLEILSIPFVGSGVLSSAMAMNKKVCKDIYRKAGLPVGKDVVVKNGEKYSAQYIFENVGSPVITKPVSEGSSIGISLCYNEEELERGIEKALECDYEVIIEEYLEGIEITCCIYGNNNLKSFPLIEIVPKKKHVIFDFEAKYKRGETEEICPARLSISMKEKAVEYAIKAHKALECRVWSRSDMIVREEEIYLLETNTIPGMTENSLFPLAARTAGLSLSDLADKIISLSLEA